MKTFLKVALIALAVLVALKLLPVTLLALGLLVAATVGVLAVGFSAAVVIACIVLGAAAALSPIWIPVLAVVGIVALVRKSSARTRTA
jgi:hypothetical protein